MFDFLFNPKGRISRKGYVLGFLLPYLVLAQIAPALLAGSPIAGILGVISFLYFWPRFVSVPIRRFHDMGLTGAYQLGFIALFVLAAAMAGQGMIAAAGGAEAFTQLSVEERFEVMNEAIQTNGRARLGVWLTWGVELAQILLFGLVPGQKGKNAYGNDPKASGRGWAD